MSKMNPTIKMTDNFRKTRRETKQNNKQKDFGLAARALILCSANEPKGFLIDTLKTAAWSPCLEPYGRFCLCCKSSCGLITSRKKNRAALGRLILSQCRLGIRPSKWSPCPHTTFLRSSFHRTHLSCSIFSCVIGPFPRTLSISL